MDIQKIAKVAHEINKAYCESIGDLSQAMWEDAPQWQRDSAINAVKFRIENIEATPEDQHKSWLKEKEADGWKYGKVKDADKKEHPCFAPYGDLPIEQRVKDFLFSQVVRSLKEPEKVFLVCEWVYSEEMKDRPNPHIEMIGIFSTKEKAIAECRTEQYFYGEFELNTAKHESTPWMTENCFPMRKDGS